MKAISAKCIFWSNSSLSYFFFSFAEVHGKVYNGLTGL